MKIMYTFLSQNYFTTKIQTYKSHLIKNLCHLFGVNEMKLSRSFSIYALIIVLIFLMPYKVIAQELISFQYISPVQGSKLNSRETNIIFSCSENIDGFSLNKKLINVTGSLSGIHDGELIMSNDNKTIIFKPFTPFAAGEEVTVSLMRGLKTFSNKYLEEKIYSFTITPLHEPIKLDPIERLGLGITAEDFKSSKFKFNKMQLDTVPPDFPTITAGTVNNPSEGKIFLTNFALGPNDTSGFFITIADNNGNVVKYNRIEPYPAFDFKVQPNGLLSYADVEAFFGGFGNCQFKVLDTSLAVVDSFQCGNGYLAELHDFQILPNGHALIFAYDPQPVDMSLIVSGGDPNAIVIGGIIQELDENKNVVFQWRSWDFIDITESYADLTASTIDYVHLNAIEADNDGNILFIGRSLSNVIKISRATGEVMWRLGGSENDFTFINEHPQNAPDYISGPHDIRRIDNGNITLFDNGAAHNPPYSRGVEYELDEQGMTATLVWEYQHDPDIFSFAMGSMQRLPNGNSLIGWGSASATGEPILTEIHPDKTVALELFYPPEVTSYRSFKFPWASGLPAATVTKYEVLEGNTYIFNEGEDTTGTKIKFNSINGFAYNSVTVKRFEYSPVNLTFNNQTPIVYAACITGTASSITSMNVDIWFSVDQIPQIEEPENTVVYHRETIGSGTFNALLTSYLSGSNELKVSGVSLGQSLGEFIFAYPDIQVVPSIPLLVSPENNKLVNQGLSLDLKWSPRGFADKFHLQVSTETNFNTTVVNDSNLTTPDYTMSSLLQEQDYYWRVKSKNSAGWGAWSDQWIFTSTASFLDLTFPDGGETWETDTSMAIKWDHNIIDSLRIELFKDGSFFQVIADSFYSVTGGFRWEITDSIPDGSNYKIKIMNLDGTLIDTSQNNFTIIYIPVGIKQIDDVVTSFELDQNFPNPFNPSTTIRYAIPVQSQVRIKIYNSIGESIAELINMSQSAGSYLVTWNAENVSSGIYFYSIDAVPDDGSEIFNSVKKMIFLK